MNRQRLLRIGVAGLLLYLLFCTVVGIIAAEVALHPPHRPLTQIEEARAPAWAKDNGATLSEVAITALDGIPLKGWELEPEDGNGDLVVLLHGRGANRLEMANYADILLAHGYSVLMPDARGHGFSEGQVATYGLLERNDVHLWMDWLVANQHPHCIYGFGESMGAAEVLQSLPLESRFCAVAAECPFSTFRESAYDRMGQALHAGPWVGRSLLRPAVEFAFLYARLRYRLDMSQVSPEDALSRTSTPVLLIHGQSDTNIPVRHSRRMKALNRAIALWEIPNTGHSNAIDTSPHELETNLVNWFSSHPPNPSSDPAQATVSPEKAPTI